jgi:ribosomal protein S18 acetylase RimI-like enzyme
MCATPAADELRIVRFDPAYRDAFRTLNLAWLTRHLVIEPIDERVLADPEGEILAPGGEILFALMGAEVVGTVALKAEGDGIFELAKMAVDERHQGRGYGLRLLEAACALAKQRGAQRVILYSRRVLKVAVAMYHKYGFSEVPLTDSRTTSPYGRCDIKMERRL